VLAEAVPWIAELPRDTEKVKDSETPATDDPKP
jgi:hypothetical protein